MEAGKPGAVNAAMSEGVLANFFNSLLSKKTGQGQSPGQGIPGQGIPGQGIPGQGIPGQGVPAQSMPGQGVQGQGIQGQPES